MRHLLPVCLIPGFYDSSEGQSPKVKSSSAEPESVSTWTYINDRPKSLGKKTHLKVTWDILRSSCF